MLYSEEITKLYRDWTAIMECEKEEIKRIVRQIRRMRPKKKKRRKRSKKEEETSCNDV